MSWQHVRGHDAVREAFARAVQRGRLAHAYLFVGPSGIGKRRFARELARALLCEASADRRELEACGACTSCKLIDAGTHPDLFTVGRPEEVNEIPIEVMRELCQGFALRSARGRGKVAILDDADDLNEESANCFLKTLEEPPPRSVFILIGTSRDRQLSTIVSRCQVVPFAPLPEPLVVELLREHELPDPALLPRLARLSGDSPGQALALADPSLWQFRRTLLDRLFRPRPETVSLAREWVQFAEEAGKQSAAQRRRAALVLKFLIEFLSEAMTVSLGGTARLGDPGDEKLLHELGSRLSPMRLMELLERCLEADVQIERYVQLTLVLEALLDALGQRL